MKVCEILRNNTGSDVSGDECVTGSQQVCPGCRQRNMCVCMVPQPTAATPSAKKKMLVLDSQRKSVLSSSAGLSPSLSIRRGKSMTTQKAAGTIVSTQQHHHHHLLAQAHTNNIMKEISEHGSTTTVNLIHPDLPPSPSSSPHPEKRDPKEKSSPAVTNSVSRSSDRSSSSGSSGENGCAPATYPRQVYHLLLRLLDPDPETRITAENALSHPFLTSSSQF